MIAVTALLTFPRIFSEAHFATLDAQLTAWWLMLWAADMLRRSDEALVRVGILAGLTSATKFTGWLAWPPLVVSRLITRDRRHVTGLLVILPVGLLTFLAVSPPLWHHPIRDLQEHLRLNLHRDLNVPISFLGNRYDKDHTLPWYNTIVWLFIVTPLPILILGLIGLGCLSETARRSVDLAHPELGNADDRACAARRAATRRHPLVSTGVRILVCAGRDRRPAGLGLLEHARWNHAYGGRARSSRCGARRRCRELWRATIRRRSRTTTSWSAASEARRRWAWSRPIGGTRSIPTCWAG